jgi:hypothetical protein
LNCQATVDSRKLFLELFLGISDLIVMPRYLVGLVSINLHQVVRYLMCLNEKI